MAFHNTRVCHEQPETPLVTGVIDWVYTISNHRPLAATLTFSWGRLSDEEPGQRRKYVRRWASALWQPNGTYSFEQQAEALFQTIPTDAEDCQAKLASLMSLGRSPGRRKKTG